ncbi:MAG: undecaprenyldiphospho-muramoylpentapeptide beta-N-acetylglucosaminyltransferase [Ignavibacteriales bacterium]|nr:undecaprenyldiphospho-muramoylpentapeptide beta-N-acetylglucosaminyltransferase [Ignavibacteriales bacterium]
MTILFAAGGTGGHLYPAIAIAEEIKKREPDAKIVFAGTKEKIEARVIPQKGFEFVVIWISGFSRRLRISNLLFPVKIVVSLIQSFFLILKLKPNVVIGTGGYVCGPVLFVASLMRIPTVVHESNSYPGVTTRMLAARVTKVFITFEATKRWISSRANIEVVGNPTRIELSSVSREAGCKYFNLDPKKKTLFAFGGSLGSASINAVMPKLIDDAIKNDYQVIWQTGESKAETLKSFQKHETIKVRRYMENIEYAYAAADMVVSRAGATTLAELTRLGKPAILVPYPYAAANHQEQNAQMMVEAGAAFMVRDEQLQEKLLSMVKELLFNEKLLREMSGNSINLGKPNAGGEIVEKVLSMRR